ncbi:MAG: hypothetical protein EPO08_17965 [Rhodospirillaceae bacterium]|nr:MAG: hypothetical protein EPO08_17965 [Rhodospirillaceae bacterium]
MTMLRWFGLSGLIVVVAAVVSARAESVTVSADDCRQLAAHVPDDDVNYKPGVDVNGNQVTPADLGGGYPKIVPDEITIPIGVDLADRLGRARAKQQGITNPTTSDRPLLPYQGQANVGTVTVNGNTVLWNGQPLAPQDEAALAAACRERLEAATPPPPKPAPPAH